VSCFTACKRTQKWRGSRHFRQNSRPLLAHISAAGFANVASDAGGLLWRKLERSESLVLLQVGGFDVPLATALCKTFLLRMLNVSWAGRNPTKGCSADWRRRRRRRRMCHETEIEYAEVQSVCHSKIFEHSTFNRKYQSFQQHYSASFNTHFKN
jgi:hypothetical protein